MLAWLTAGGLAATAAPMPGPWVPIFKGVAHAGGTNVPGIAGNFPRLQVVYCERVDLTDPDIRLFTTPRATGYVAESRETLSLTVPDFLKQNHLQVASDANFYDANPGGADPSSEGVPCNVYGLQISSGTVVSADSVGDNRYAALLFTTNNQPSFVFINRPPGTNTAGIATAITGYYPIVSNGVNIGAASINAYPDSFIHGEQPRTAFGVSQDNRYLFILTIDGRQDGYSVGALDSETAYWMLAFGAWNAINMDGGGSTALYISDAAGNPVAVNHSSYLAAGYGHERYIGSHFGVWAKPLPGFINNVVSIPDDTAATITWDTTDPATTQVAYGLTADLGLLTAVQTALTTNHAINLTGLTPATDYYFQVISTAAGQTHSSSNFLFTTTNYIATSQLFDITNAWTYTTADLDGVNWTTPSYDDSGWIGSGPGLLWVDVRSTGPDPNVQPKNTQMPANPKNNGYPFVTYYFRTHFTFTNALSGVSLVLSNYVDDGAVFYLNGAEIYRLRMAPAPAVIANSTLASGYPCPDATDYGNAVCPDVFPIGSDLATNLEAGDNVLAAEVHNYSALSPDITFGSALFFNEPVDASPELSLAAAPGAITLNWTRGGFTLQSAPSPTGPWADVPGPVAIGPFTTATSDAAGYYRLYR
ncbi:MAG: phosphodiester glycosidase family protein [Verrucomicrobiota bacterium]